MRYSSLIFSLVASVAAQAPAQSPASSFPLVPILPLQGVPDVSSGNGLSSIASSLVRTTQSLAIQSGILSM